MPVFYAPDIKTNPCLSEEESQHAVKVLRLSEGADIVVYDGKGGVYDATIAQAHPKHCLLNSIVEHKDIPAKPYYLQMVVAPTKNMDRFEWFAEKAAEIGVDRITPVICDFSERKIIKTERVKKILISAMKQSLQPKLVEIDEAVSFKDFMKSMEGFEGQRFIAHCHKAEKPLLKNVINNCGRHVMMIGPEGDFSEKEVELALKNNFQAVSLGDMRLRVETAALFSVFSFANSY